VAGVVAVGDCWLPVLLLIVATLAVVALLGSALDCACYGGCGDDLGRDNGSSGLCCGGGAAGSSAAVAGAVVAGPLGCGGEVWLGPGAVIGRSGSFFGRRERRPGTGRPVGGWSGSSLSSSPRLTRCRPRSAPSRPRS
jgi:hypothetical protein